MARLKDPKVIFWIVIVLAIMVGSAKYLPIELPHIQVPPEILFTLPILPIPITNTFLSLLLSDVILIGLALVATRKLEMVPSGVQNFFEGIIEFWQGTAVSQVGEKLARTWLPMVLTVFFTIWFSNYLHFLPGFDSVGILCEVGHCPGQTAAVAKPSGTGAAPAEASKAESKPLSIQWSGGQEGEGWGKIVKSPKEPVTPAPGSKEFEFVPFLRVSASDLNLTLALAILAFLVIELAGFRQLGVGYLGKFFNFKEGAMMIIVGLLELFSEVMRLITFSFRLFGNVFAGQTLLFVFPFLVPLLLVLPIYGLEMFVGLIQAYVFAVLILAFMEQAVTAHGGDHH